MWALEKLADGTHSNLKSPQILELSGIGDPAILEPLGIDPVIEISAVGTNVQDHYSCIGPIPGIVVPVYVSLP